MSVEAERDRYRQALDEIRQFAGRCWTDREATYEHFGDIATMAENALATTIGGSVSHE